MIFEMIVALILAPIIVALLPLGIVLLVFLIPLFLIFIAFSFGKVYGVIVLSIFGLWGLKYTDFSDKKSTKKAETDPTIMKDK